MVKLLMLFLAFMVLSSASAFKCENKPCESTSDCCPFTYCTLRTKICKPRFED